uniref:Uncharacterized protein n=1 Tax=Heterorhabditis bacteriophora TaxID=37862 RepID=A0A1I7X4I9_HETBA
MNQSRLELVLHISHRLALGFLDLLKTSFIVILIIFMAKRQVRSAKACVGSTAVVHFGNNMLTWDFDNNPT